MFRFVLYFFLFLFNYFHYIGTVTVFCGTRSAATTYSFCWFTVGLLIVVAFYFIFRYNHIGVIAVGFFFVWFYVISDDISV